MGSIGGARQQNLDLPSKRLRISCIRMNEGKAQTWLR